MASGGLGRRSAPTAAPGRPFAPTDMSLLSFSPEPPVNKPKKRRLTDTASSADEEMSLSVGTRTQRNSTAVPKTGGSRTRCAGIVLHAHRPQWSLIARLPSLSHPGAAQGSQSGQGSSRISHAQPSATARAFRSAASGTQFDQSSVSDLIHADEEVEVEEDIASESDVSLPMLRPLLRVTDTRIRLT